MKWLYLLFLFLTLPAQAGLTLGLGAGKFNTHEEFSPMGGTVYERDNQDKVYTLSAGFKDDITSWLDYEASFVYLGTLQQYMSGRGQDSTQTTCKKAHHCTTVSEPGPGDIRRTETTTYGIELTLQPHWEIFYLKAGIMQYYSRHYMEGTLGSDARTVGNSSGVIGGGLRFKHFQIEYTLYNNIYTRNSDLGGYYKREEYRNFSQFQIKKEF